MVLAAASYPIAFRSAKQKLTVSAVFAITIKKITAISGRTG
jgi:hypothetical protein